MGSDLHYPTKASGKASKSGAIFKNKDNLIFLGLTVLCLQVADSLLAWLTNTGTQSNYWSLDSTWTQVDIFVGIFAIFYLGKHYGKCLYKKKDEPSCASTEAEQPRQQESNASSSKWQTKSVRPERRVSFNKDVETVEPMQKTSTLRAEAPAFATLRADAPAFETLRAGAPAFVSQVAQDQSLRAEAPAFIPKTNQEHGLRAQAPLFVPKAQARVVPPPPPPLHKAFATPPGMDDDNVGTVLFRSACSASAEKEKDKPVFKPKEEGAAKQSKWQPKERTIWKSSHVYGA
jgi:hypothetical protein